MLLNEIKRAREDFMEEYNIYPNAIFIGRDVRFVMGRTMSDFLKQHEDNGVVPWRYLKVFGMSIVPVDSDMYFAVGLKQDIMYDI